MNRHLNFNQSFLINASETILFYERLTSNELLNKTFRPTNDTLIHFHPINTTSTKQKENLHIESQLETLAPFGNGHSNTNYSRSLSLSLFDENGKEIIVKNISHKIELIIPRDPQMKVPPLIYENVSNHTESFRWKSINLRELQTNPNLSFSLHFQFFPVMNRTKIAYAFVYQFDQSPQFDRLDGSTLLCPSTINDEILSTYIDNQQISNNHHHLLIIGIRELTREEFDEFCSSTSISSKKCILQNPQAEFSIDFEWRIFSSSCCYLNDEHFWQSDGLLVRVSSSFIQQFPSSFHFSFRLDQKPISIKRNA